VLGCSGEECKSVEISLRELELRTFSKLHFAHHHVMFYLLLSP
jgi:hypothetical protein